MYSKYTLIVMIMLVLDVVLIFCTGPDVHPVPLGGMCAAWRRMALFGCVRGKRQALDARGKLKFMFITDICYDGLYYYHRMRRLVNIARELPRQKANGWRPLLTQPPPPT